MIEVRPSLNQIDDLIEEIQQRCEVDERVFGNHFNQKNGGRVDQIFDESSPSVAVTSILMLIL